MAHAATAGHGADHSSKTQFYVVWGILLVATIIEVGLAYMQMNPVPMLTILIGLSVIKAALIIYYFMHLKYEVVTMRRMLMVSLVVCLVLMCIFFPDAFRILRLGVGIEGQ
ncbi:MAG: cytochrome C oxidase subunit IV family protein [Candidatus Korobacteraceae bacterium]